MTTIETPLTSEELLQLVQGGQIKAVRFENVAGELVTTIELQPALEFVALPPTEISYGGKLTLEQYHAEICRLAIERKLIEPGETMYDAEAWRDAYDEGLSPDEALSEEVLACAEIGA
jgi:hypothetical protein